ncbi:MAG TPA: ATP synthase F0 subunit A, partial [Caldithrix sp.]|nr:ATP synthase F0 subunit A [Caldithrix sp.]
HLPTFEPINVLGVQIDLSITLHVVMMWVASLILILTFWLLFRKKRLVPRGFAAILESMVLFVRDEIAVPNMGIKNGKKFTPLLATMFFFILTCNLMGLIPLFVTATGNISVTASLAIITFFVTQIMGMVENGAFGYFKSMVPSGIPFPLIFIMVPIEIFGLFTKPFALAMRLFANMIAGHTVVFALLGLIIALGTVLVAPFGVGFAVFIDLLEILVAFIQAYIFTMLSSLFISMAMHPEH